MRKLIVFAIMTTLLPFSTQKAELPLEKEQATINQDELSYGSSESVLLKDDDQSFMVDIPSSTQINEAMTAEQIEEASFAKRYFTHLVDNKITNNLGNCVYTAIGMYLSYLDTYWNGAFIPSQYESNYPILTSSTFQDSYNPVDYQSPGIRDTFDYTPSYSRLQETVYCQGIPINDENYIPYQEAMESLLVPYIKKELASCSFLGYLFSLAIKCGVISPHYTWDSFPSYGESNDEENEKTVANESNYQYHLRVNNWGTVAIINQYILDNPQLKNAVSISSNALQTTTNDTEGSDKQEETEDEEDDKITEEEIALRDEIVALLKQGKPVLVFGRSGSSDYHAAIAYEYNELNDRIYGNLGYGEDDVHVNFDRFFGFHYTFHLCLDINSSVLPRTYTHRYFFSDWNQFYSPYENAHVSHPITPSDYGFADAYPTDEDTMNVGMQHRVPNESVYFTTKRYRTGYIQQHSVVMSCIKTGITNAYIEYEFTNPIYGIIVNMSYWREFEHDLLDGTTGRAGLKIYGYQDPNSQYDEGGWINCYDFLNSTNPLSRDRDRPSEYVIDFDQPIRRIQFYASVNTPMESDRNKGRICIGNLYVITSRDHTFY